MQFCPKQSTRRGMGTVLIWLCVATFYCVDASLVSGGVVNGSHTPCQFSGTCNSTTGSCTCTSADFTGPTCGVFKGQGCPYTVITNKGNNYDVVPVPDLHNRSSLVFAVQALKDAYVKLNFGSSLFTFIEIVIGGNGNTNVQFRYNTPKFYNIGTRDGTYLDCNAYRTFWLTWYTKPSVGTNVTLGQGGEVGKSPIQNGLISSLSNVTSVSVAAYEQDVIGHWIFDFTDTSRTNESCNVVNTKATNPCPVSETTATSSVPQTTASSSVPQTTASSSVPQTTASSSVPQTTATSSVPQTTASSPVHQTTASSPVHQTTATSHVQGTEATATPISTDNGPSTTLSTASLAVSSYSSSPLTATASGSTLPSATASRNISMGVVKKCTCVRVKLLTRKETEEAKTLAMQTGMEMKKNLTVNKTQTSTSIRKKVSASDERQSAQHLGTLGVVMLTAVLSLVVVPDLFTLTAYVQARLHSATRRRRRIEPEVKENSSHC